MAYRLDEINDPMGAFFMGNDNKKKSKRRAPTRKRRKRSTLDKIFGLNKPKKRGPTRDQIFAKESLAAARAIKGFLRKHLKTTGDLTDQHTPPLYNLFFEEKTQEFQELLKAADAREAKKIDTPITIGKKVKTEVYAWTVTIGKKKLPFVIVDGYRFTKMDCDPFKFLLVKEEDVNNFSAIALEDGDNVFSGAEQIDTFGLMAYEYDNRLNYEYGEEEEENIHKMFDLADDDDDW